jgi:LmbE family N-acetylglucosaminyl deacetylase/CTP:molybdopterin cytidylyltransferase MocA
MRPRLLVVSPHPDDETFFMGGTLARYAAVADVRLVVVGDGENGKRAVAGSATPLRPTSRETHAFVAERRRQCRAAALTLGVGAVEFLGFRDWSCPGLLVALLRARLTAHDPHVVLSLSEAGTTAHPDHSRTAIALYRAVRSRLSATYGDRLRGELPFAPPFSLRRYLTYTLPVAAERFDYWGELAVPPGRLTRVDVRRTLAAKRRAARAHVTQAHWADYLERVGVLGLPEECFLERVCIGPSAAGATDLLGGIDHPSLRLSVSEMPLPAGSYTWSGTGLHETLTGYAGAADAQAIRSVVLASGHGIRMGDPGMPKSLQPLNGRPLIRYIVEASREAGVDDRPLVLVGPGGDRIRGVLGPGHDYVEQRDVLGTGHALACCRPALEAAGARHVMVFYGDKPALSKQTVRALAVRHLQDPAPMTLATVKLPDFEGWRRHLLHAGRIVRGAAGRVVRVVEHVDADDGEREITEINGGLYCFRGDWLWRNVHRLRRENRKSEYYLTDLVALAAAEGEAVATIDIPPEEALGVNTREDLARVGDLLAGWGRGEDSSGRYRRLAGEGAGNPGPTLTETGLASPREPVQARARMS